MALQGRRRLLAWTFMIGAVLGLLLAWTAGSAMTGPTNALVPALGDGALGVTMDSQDGVRLSGSYWASGSSSTAAVLLLHGNGGDRRQMVPMANWLSRQGYPVLAIDFRGHGESTPMRKSFGLEESRDAKAAFDWLKRKHPSSRIAVIGYSLGGAAALLGDQGPLPADAMVLESVYPDIRRAIFNRIAAQTGAILAYVGEPLLSFQSLPRYGVWPSRISPIRATREVKAPVMIVGGAEDRYTPRAETEAMFEAAGRNGDLVILNGISHDQVVSVASPEFRARLLRFLQSHLS